MADVVMRIILSASAGNTGRIIGDVARQLGMAGGLGGVLAGVGIAATIAAAAIGIVAVKMAGDFQQGLNRLVTGAGDVTDNMQKMGQAILGISADSGVLTGPLLQAMYQIISAGERGAQAENTLAVAAKGSVVEQANVVDVAKALTTAMTDYGTAQFNATQFMNGYTRAVQLGKITLEELSTSMGPILPLAQNLGIHFQDVAAAMSTMTNAGIPAARAATSLRFLFQSLEKPTKAAETAMKEWGVNSTALANELKVSLPGALQMVYDAAKRAGPEGSKPFNNAVSDMIGGQRSLQAYLALTGSHMKTFAGDSKAIATAMEGSKTAVLGWDVAQSGFNVQMDRAKAAVSALLITIGTNLLPVLTQFLMAVTPLIVNFAKFISSGQAANDIMTIFHTVMSTVMSVVAAVTPFFQAVWTILQGIGGYLAAIFKPVWDQLVAVWQSQLLPALKQLWEALQPLMPLFIGIGAVILGVVVIALGVLFGVLTGLIKALAYVLSAVVQVFGGIVKIISGAVQVIAGIIRFFVDLFTGNFKKLGSDLKVIWNGIVLIFQGAWDVISGIFKAAWGAISGFVGGLVQGIIGFFQHLASVLVGHSIVPDMINAIVQVFLSLPGRALSAVGSLLGQLAGFFGNLASQAISWGANIIGGVIGGIQSMAGALFSAVGTTIHNALAQIPGVAGHVPGFAAGVTNFAGGYAVVGERGPELVYMPQGSSVYPQVNTSGGSSGAAINIYISTMAGSRSEVERMADLIEQELGRRFRGQTPGFASGGIFG